MKGFIESDTNWCVCVCVFRTEKDFVKARGCEKGAKLLSHTLLHTVCSGLCVCASINHMHVLSRQIYVCVLPHSHVLCVLTVN